MIVEREKLLRALTVARTGLAKKEGIEQSNFFVFTKTSLITFNSWILTRVRTPLKGIVGAVLADDLYPILMKFPDPEVEVTTHKGELRIKGRRRELALAMQSEIHLPYKEVPSPGEWEKVPEKLSGILLQAARCCGDDETQPTQTVVHLCPDMVEACDNSRLFRYQLQTGVPETLIPASSLESVNGQTIKAVSRTKGWIHFLLPGKHQMSLLLVKAKYPDLTHLLEIEKPRRVNLPSNMEDILSRAEMMQEASFDASVGVTLEKGRMTLTSRKDTGWYRESKKVDYKAEPLRFSVHPKFLQEVLAKKKSVYVGGDKMKLVDEEATFVISLEIGKQDE
jgi:hypothetical protein